jgi:hypothetical protein
MASYADTFAVDQLTACAVNSDCRTKAPWALDGCNWVLAGTKSGYYCTGLRTCATGQSGDISCGLYALSRGVGGAQCVAKASSTNVPVGFTGASLCNGTAGAAPINPTETVSALAAQVQVTVPFLAGCYQVYHNPAAAPTDLDIQTADPSACAATDAAFAGEPGKIYGVGFSSGGTITSEATPLLNTPLATPAPGTQWACLETPQVPIGQSATLAYCIAGADGQCIGTSRKTKSCGSAALPAPFGPDMPKPTAPAVGDHVWIVEGG